MSKEYLRGTIYTTTQGAEALAAMLPALGVFGYSVEDPADLDFIIASKDKLAWDFVGLPEQESAVSEVRLSFWLDITPDTEAKIQDIRIMLLKLKGDEQYGNYGEGADFGRLWMETETVRDDWKDKYRENFRTFSPCEGIVVTPPWEAEVIRGDTGGNIRIIIDPGMAFGTGSHETTAMCLARLKGLLKPGDRLLDAGTGSGILAIAAVMFGAGRVDAVEIDTDAAASAAGAIETNGVGGRVSLIIGDITRAGTLPEGARYELITANLSCPIIEVLLPSFKAALAEGGAIILSGMLDAQEERALEALDDAGLIAADIARSGEWIMIEARVPAGGA